MTWLERLDAWACDSTILKNERVSLSYRQKITSFKLCKSPSGFKSEGCLMFIHLFRRKKTHCVRELDANPWSHSSGHFRHLVSAGESNGMYGRQMKKITFPSRCPIHFNQYTFYWMWPKSIAYNKPSQRSCVHVSESISYTCATNTASRCVTQSLRWVTSLTPRCFSTYYSPENLKQLHSTLCWFWRPLWTKVVVFPGTKSAPASCRALDCEHLFWKREKETYFKIFFLSFSFLFVVMYN